MNNAIKNSIIRVAALLLVFTLMVPNAVKLSHAFNHSKHKVCFNDHSTHIHQVDLDCEFQKFQFNSHYTFLSYHYSFAYLTPFLKKSTLEYNYFYNHRQLSFSLRGPPVLV